MICRFLFAELRGPAMGGYESWADRLHERVKLEMAELRAYIEASEKAFDSAFDSFAEREAEREAKMEADEAELHHEYMTDEAFGLGKRFPRFGRHMAFASTFNEFEGSFVQLADTAGRIKKIGFKVRDLRYEGIEAAKEYLSKGIGITTIFGQAKWQRIQVYGKLRNVITHHNSTVQKYYQSSEKEESKASKEFKDWVRVTAPIEIETFGKFTLSKDYCLKAIDTIESFLEELLPLLPKPVSD
jgi:hypothetical protein